MSLGPLAPDALGEGRWVHGIRNEGLALSLAGGDGHDFLGCGPGLRGAAHRQPPGHPQCHRGLSLAAGQN